MNSLIHDVKNGTKKGYSMLMESHISHAINYWGDTWSALKQGKARENYGLRALEGRRSPIF